jgi:hypothetical protein
VRDPSGAQDRDRQKADGGGAAGGGQSGGGTGGGYTYDDTDKDWMADEKLEAHMTSYPVGGNENLRNPTAWMETMVNAAAWRVIARNGIASVFDFLPPDTKPKVDGIWDMGRRKAWALGTTRC